MKKRICIRTDGNTQIGLGHIMRCFSLAQILSKSYNIRFYCRYIPDLLANKIKSNGIDVFRINTEKDFLDQLNDTDIVLLDGYDFDMNYQIQVKEKNVKLVCVDDLHDKHYMADVVINHTPGIQTSDYEKENYTKTYLGLKYALLRKPFLLESGNTKASIVLKSIFICYGGGDAYNYTLKTLQELKEMENLKKVDLLISSGFRFREEIEVSRQHFNFDMHVHIDLDAEEIIKAIKNADACITAPSTVSLEVLMVGKPLYLNKTAENQNFNFQYLLHKGAAKEVKEIFHYTFEQGTQMLGQQKAIRSNNQIHNLKSIFKKL